MIKQSDSSIRYISDLSPVTPSFVVDFFIHRERKTKDKKTNSEHLKGV